MAVLRSLKRLRVLNLSSNPVCEQGGYRAWVLANAQRLEILDETAVVDGERGELKGDGNNAGSGATQMLAPVIGGLAGDASVRGTGRRLFGVPLAELLLREQSSIPTAVQECTRHVQQRQPAIQTALTADGDPSLVLTLRNAFEAGES